MRVKWALKIDRAVGMPIGLALRAMCRLWPRARRTPGPLPSPRNIVVIKALGFGSIVQMAPMLQSLRSAYPQARITLLTFQQNAGLAALMPLIDTAECIEFRQGLVRFFLQSLSRAWRLRRLRPELVIDAEFFSYYAAFLTWLISWPRAVSIGYYNNRRSKDWIFTHAIAIDLSEHITECFKKALSPLGINGGAMALEHCGFRVAEAAERSMEERLREMGVAPHAPIVVANINASDLCLNRRWPAENFQRMVRALHERGHWRDAAIIFIGAPEDVPYVGACLAPLKDIPQVHDLSGRTSLAELAALLKRATLFVGNDSGPLHLAEAFGTPCIAFFGPETPRLYGPRGEQHTVFYTRPHCSPCLNAFYSKDNKCNNNICVKAITVDAVAEAVRGFLHR